MIRAHAAAARSTKTAADSKDTFGHVRIGGTTRLHAVYAGFPSFSILIQKLTRAACTDRDRQKGVNMLNIDLYREKVAQMHGILKVVSDCL